jgi:Protein kinase domain
MAARPMADMIGKYRVLDRLGRGGMGTVLKAHDPALDRVVALKVISSDIEVTDELRARFFREAQAGARLSHPNIVTVYDLAEADGRLVIVMEFLDGDELRQVIAQRRPLGLDEKLAIMIQICDGLGYAHQRGIVHRDIKPGNILVLRDGRAKILDFGVARIVTAEAGLTRTGRIMGTLRYIAPEQARGRADHRSDIFSVGTVFYELVAYRPAFPGDDPMEILEALRSDDPPLLNEVDSSIPPDLAALIARAMHKDPERRVQDLVEMRQGFDAIRQRVLVTLDLARQHVRSRLDQVRQLQATAADQLGDEADEETLPIPQDGGLATLAAIEQNAANRVARLTALLASAARLQPAFEQGVALLAAGGFEGAIATLEPVVREVPEHARARRALAEARARLEDERRKSLEQAAGRAHQSHDAMDLARAAAEEAEASLFAAVAWQGAQMRSANGEAAMARQDYALATELLDSACELYRQAGADAHEIRRRRAQSDAEDAGRDLAQARDVAVRCDAERSVPAVWRAAVKKEALGNEGLRRQDFVVASASFAEAREHYERAVEIARQERTRQEREVAERARAETERVREIAQQAEAGSHATRTWTTAEQVRAESEALLSQSAYTDATARFTNAASLYKSASEEAPTAVRMVQQRMAETAGARAAERRRLAEEAGAPRDADILWTIAGEAAALGRAAADRGDFLEASVAFERAARGFGEAETAARKATVRRSALAEQADAIELASYPSGVVEQATVAVPLTTTPASSPVYEAPSRQDAAAAARAIIRRTGRRRSRMLSAGAVALGLIALAVGGRWFYTREPTPESTSTPVITKAPAPKAPDTKEAVRDQARDRQKRLDEVRTAAAGAREIASRSGANVVAKEPFDSATRRWNEAESAASEGNVTAAIQNFSDAGRIYRDADRLARERQALRRDAETARERAKRAGADFLAKDRFDTSSARLAEAERLARAQDWAAAARVYADAAGQYAEAERLMRDIDKVRAEAEKTKERREQARLAGAESLARESFDAAAARHVEADRLARGTDVTAAIPVYRDAAQRYADAEKRARETRQN